jgi:ribosomal protein S18 acetylase RimI-like enzyme
MAQIRFFNPENDQSTLLELWELIFVKSLEQRHAWPLTPTWLVEVLQVGSPHSHHLLLEVDDQVVGFALVQSSPGEPPGGSIMALGVHPEFRRRGLGRLLHDAALEQLRAQGAKKASLGSGGMHCFWPGLPVELDAGWAFFQKLGWKETERSVDLARPLEDYQTPDWVFPRVSELGVEFVTADAAGLEGQAVEFVGRELPDWEEIFAEAVADKRGGDILLARRAGSDEIQAACLVDCPSPRWELRFERPVGAPGCILTGEAFRGRGIGMALTARATEIAKERGARSAYLFWTWLVDWYGKLGYTVCQEYIHAEIDV